MPSLIYSPNAIRDIKRLIDFLKENNHLAAAKAAQTIDSALLRLKQQPTLGRVASDMDEAFRELLIPFGNAGYVARYHYQGSDTVEVLALRHYREIGFKFQ